MKTQFVLFAATLILTNTIGNIPFPSGDNSVQKVSRTQNAGFAFLRTHRQGKNVAATWGLTSNDGVIGFLVQRTYMDATDPYAAWEDIASIPFNPSRSFKYTDQNCLPGLIHYRVFAFMTDGSAVMSEISDVRIVSH